MDIRESKNDKIQTVLAYTSLVYDVWTQYYSSQSNRGTDILQVITLIEIACQFVSEQPEIIVSAIIKRQ